MNVAIIPVGNRIMRSSAPIERRFLSKIWMGLQDECWPWLGRRNVAGYGIFGIGKYGKVLAHRKAWELRNGPIPVGLHVLHKCDNPPCVNPEHLYVGTQADNVADMIRRGRHRNGREGMSKEIKCGHPDRRYFALGRCRLCYLKFAHRRRRGLT